ncbi:cytochrome P450 [Actinoplanes sp. NPDC049316]|uniref:cytochrome P450 n=1 Tax=Actinoplanes sp. NPDC049316 TaxID=3154727 RepID=UPI003442CD16
MTATETASGAAAGRTDPIPDLDLADPDPARTPGIDALLAGLRRDRAVFWHGPKSRPGFWAVLGYEATLKVYRDSATFSAAHGMTLDTLRAERDPAGGLMLEVTDPPEHRRLRRSVAGIFADGIVATLTPQIDRYARDLLVRIRDGGTEIDFAEAVAARIPTHAAGLLLGLPPEDLDWITERTALVFLSGGPADAGVDQRAAAEQANGELLGYFARLLRRVRPGSGAETFVQRLAAGTGKRDALSTGEVVLNALNVAIGGTTTTRSALTNLMEALIRYPAVFAALRAGPEAVPAAVEEAVRWGNPVRHLARVATRDVQLAGAPVRAGDPVVVWPRSANRDEAVFARPETFDPHRHPNPHLGFAAGTHGCPGTALGRAQLRAVLRHTVDLFGGAEAAGPAELIRSNFLHGYAHLPVRFTTGHLFT